jgi:hypothetical protein
MRPIAHITVQHRRGRTYPVVLEWGPTGEAELVARADGAFELTDDLRAALDSTRGPAAYGAVLGSAIFRDDIRSSFALARGRHPRLLVLSSIEDEELRRTIVWEWMCVPADDDWTHPQLDQRFGFARLWPSKSTHPFSVIRRAELRALIVIGDGIDVDGTFGLTQIPSDKIAHELTTALAPIECEVLSVQQDKPPSLERIAAALTQKHYPILHIAAHGKVDEDRAVVYLTDEYGDATEVAADDFVASLKKLEKLPSLAFLSICSSAVPKQLDRSFSARVVEELGLPAVIGMTESVTISLANDFATHAYRTLLTEGHIESALATAGAILQRRKDSLVPILSTRLRGQRLFALDVEAPITTLSPADVERVRAWFTNVAPGAAPRLDGKLDADAIESLDTLCETSLATPLCEVIAQPAPLAPVCPFLGLRAFTLDDARGFFGREKLTQSIVDRLRVERFAVLAGASGSGKSSLARAGVLAALIEAGGLTPTEEPVFKPGTDPVTTLRAAIAKFPTVIVVDQLEEVFTAGGTAEQRAEREQQFFDSLLAAAVTRMVVVTVRADFLAECLTHPEFRDRVQAHLHLVGPFDDSDLRRAIELQASSVGIRLEPDLAKTVLDEVRTSRVAMPLVQHALRESWYKRCGAWIDDKAYQATTGVAHALSKTAQDYYDRQTVADQATMRELFLRLVRVDESDAREGTTTRRDTRIRVPRSELVVEDKDQTQIVSMVSELASLSLLTTDKDRTTNLPVVEIAHESLLLGWSTLQKWVDEDRESALARSRLQHETREWSASGRSEPLLLHRGERLHAIEERAAQGKIALTELERQYIGACRSEENREQSRRRRTRRLTIGSGIGVMLTIIGALLFGWQSQTRRVAEVRAALEHQRIAVAAEQAATGQRLWANDNIEDAILSDLQALLLAPENDSRREFYLARLSFISSLLPRALSIDTAPPGDQGPDQPLLLELNELSPTGGYVVWRNTLYRIGEGKLVRVVELYSGTQHTPELSRVGGQTRVWHRDGRKLAVLMTDMVISEPNASTRVGGSRPRWATVIGIYNAENGQLTSTIPLPDGITRIAVIAFCRTTECLMVRVGDQMIVYGLDGRQLTSHPVFGEVTVGDAGGSDSFLVSTTRTVDVGSFDGRSIRVVRLLESFYSDGKEALSVRAVAIDPSAEVATAVVRSKKNECLLFTWVPAKPESLVRESEPLACNVEWLGAKATSSMIAIAINFADGSLLQTMDVSKREIASREDGETWRSSVYSGVIELVGQNQAVVIDRERGSLLDVEYGIFSHQVIGVRRWWPEYSAIHSNGRVFLVEDMDVAIVDIVRSSPSLTNGMNVQKATFAGDLVLLFHASRDEEVYVELVGEKGSRWRIAEPEGEEIRSSLFVDVEGGVWTRLLNGMLTEHSLISGEVLREHAFGLGYESVNYLLKSGMSCATSTEDTVCLTSSGTVKYPRPSIVLTGDRRYLLSPVLADPPREWVVIDVRTKQEHMLSVPQGAYFAFAMAADQASKIELAGSGSVRTVFSNGAIVWSDTGGKLEANGKGLSVQFEVPGAGTECSALSPDGRLSARIKDTNSNNDELKVTRREVRVIEVYDVTNGTTIAEVPGPLLACRFSSDGSVFEVIDSLGSRRRVSLNRDLSTIPWAQLGVDAISLDELSRVLSAAQSNGDDMSGRIAPYVRRAYARNSLR